jgi:hypothetical protein
MVLLDRLTWGINASSAAHLQAVGAERGLAEQLHPRQRLAHLHRRAFGGTGAGLGSVATNAAGGEVFA